MNNEIHPLAPASEKRYNQSRMTSETIGILLVLFLAAMFALALLSLRRRALKWHQFAAWGLLALLVPILGPFIVILARPGESKALSDAASTRHRRLKL